MPFVQSVKTGGDVMERLLPLPPRPPPDTGALKASSPRVLEDFDYGQSCTDNLAFGYEALSHVVLGHNAGKGPGGKLGWPPVDDAPGASSPAPVWHCAYCGQSNAAEREGCRGCQAARPLHAAMVHERVTTWKGVLLSRLTEEERDEMAAWLTGPDAWRYPLPVLDADMKSRVRAALRQQLRPEPEDDTMVTRTLTGESIRVRGRHPQEPVESESFEDRWEAKYKGTKSWADIAKVSRRRQLLNRLKQCVGLR